MKKVDLNVDMGEGFPYDEDLLQFATSANIACGGYAGTAEITAGAVALCRNKGARIGAHPGYPDREGFGRRSARDADALEIEWAVRTAEAFKDFAEAYSPDYIKPHGALYNESARPLGGREMQGRVSEGSSAPLSLDFLREHHLAAWTVAIMLTSFPCPLMGLPGTSHETLSVFATRKRGGPALIREGFADRRYREDGLLAPRAEEDALLSDEEEIRQQVLRLAERVDSICLHGDNPHCLEYAELVFKTLVDAGYEVGY